MNINWVALVVLIVLFAVVTVMGFQAAKWRRPDNLASLHEWGLGGKSFGTVTTWFLLGGDLYTAYTFIAAGICGLSFYLLKREREAYERREGRTDAAKGGSR